MSTSTMKQNAHPSQGSHSTKPWVALASVIFGAIMAFLDATMVNIALVSIQKGLHVDLSTVSWVLSAYNIPFAMMLIPAGRLADQFGRKRLFLCGIALFGLGSLLCVFAPSIGWLIAARTMQGGGGAVLTAVGLAVISSVFPDEGREAAIGFWGALSGLAIAIGPALGGFLVRTLGWEWIFIVNLPLCVISFIMVIVYVPETHDPHQSKRIDISGLLTLFAAIFCLVLGIIQGNAWGWASPLILSLFTGALLGGLLFVIVEQRQAEPMIRLQLFTLPGFTVANVTMLLFAIALMGAFVIFVLFLQDRGDDPLKAAYLLLPTPFSAFIVSSFAGIISRYVSARIQALAGMLILAIGLMLLSTLNFSLTFLDAAWRGCIIGVGMGLCFTSLPALALARIPAARLGVGSGVFNTCQQVGFTLGVAILISILVGQSHASQLNGFVVTWRVSACLAGGGALLMLLTLLRSLGKSASQDREAEKHRKKNLKTGRL